MKDQSFGIIPVFKKRKKYYFLLIQHHAGHWSFPKGHPQKEESEIETAKRELSEETGIIDFKLIDKVSFLEKYKYKNNGILIDKTVKYFVAIVNKNEVQIQEKEIQDYKWVDFEEALKLITFPGAIEILKQAKNYLDS